MYVVDQDRVSRGLEAVKVSRNQGKDADAMGDGADQSMQGASSAGASLRSRRRKIGHTPACAAMLSRTRIQTGTVP